MGSQSALKVSGTRSVLKKYGTALLGEVEAALYIGSASRGWWLNLKEREGNSIPIALQVMMLPAGHSRQEESSITQ